MSPTSEAILASWSLDSKIALGVLASFILYLRGWVVLHRTSPERFPVWRLWAFTGGVAASWLAIASPLDAFSGLLLSAHMVQHLLLMSVAPPLLLLGTPLLAVAARIAKEIRSRRSRPLPGLARAAPGCATAHASGELLDCDGDNSLCLARAVGVRPGASLVCLAQGRARLFPGSVAPLLVACGSPLSQPTAVAGVVGAPLPAAAPIY